MTSRAKTQSPLFIEAYTAPNYNGSPAEFGKEKSLINVFQASVIQPFVLGKDDAAEKICRIDGLFVRYSFETLKAELQNRGVMLPELRK